MATTSAPDVIRLSDLPPASGRAGIIGTLKSEWTKLTSVRSTYWTLLTLVVICVGLGSLIDWAVASHWNQMHPADRATFDATNQSLSMLYLGQLVIAVLGVLAITTEYSTGMIRTSLTAMPRRTTLYVAKAAVFAVVAVVVGEITSFAMYFIGQAVLHSTGHATTLSDPGVLRAVIGGGLFLTGCGLFAFGIGALIRHTAGAITLAVAIMFVVPILSGLLPQSWQNNIQKFSPISAAGRIWSTRNDSGYYGHWTEFGIFLGYVAILLVAGLVLMRRRDA
jgi:ABC-2 type transport system permease protein